MLKTLAKAALVLGGLGALVFWIVTAPSTLDGAALAAIGKSDVTKNETVF